MPVSKKTAASPAPGPVKEAKPKKPKLVRDSFTCPKDEYAAIEALKLRLAQSGHVAKKSEVLRAGLMLLAGLSDARLLAALQAVPSVKTGRPAKAEQTVAAADPAPAPAPAPALAPAARAQGRAKPVKAAKTAAA